jgi:hypothetical protein
MNKATENIATSSQDAQRQMQGQPTAAGQSRQTEAAPSEQSQKMTAGTTEQTSLRQMNNQRRWRLGTEPSPSEKPAGEDC